MKDRELKNWYSLILSKQKAMQKQVYIAGKPIMDEGRIADDLCIEYT